MDKPRQPYLDATYKVHKYIKQTPRQGILLLSTGALQLQAFCDPNWARCKDTRSSVTDCCILLEKALVYWRTKKQTTISRSSAEAEYRSMATYMLRNYMVEKHFKGLTDKSHTTSNFLM